MTQAACWLAAAGKDSSRMMIEWQTDTDSMCGWFQVKMAAR